MKFDDKITYKVRAEDSLKLAPKKPAVFDWIMLKNNMRSSKKLEKIFILLANIFFNFEDMGFIKYAIEDMELYLQSNTKPLGLIKCAYSENATEKVDFVNVVVTRKAPNSFIELSFNMLRLNFIRKFSKVFIIMLFYFMKVPNNKLEKDLERFEMYMKLRYNIRRFDIDHIKSER